LNLRIRRIILGFLILSLIYLIGIYVVESKFIARMFFWRASIFLKPLSFASLILFTFNRIKTSRASAKTFVGISILFAGLMLQSFSHSYKGGLIFLIGLSVLTEQIKPVDVGMIILSLLVLIFTSPFSPNIAYMVLLLLAPIYLLSRPISTEATNLEIHPRTAILAISALFILSRVLQPEQPIGNSLLPISMRESFAEADLSYYLTPEEKELITWASRNTPQESIFIVPPRDFLGIKFRSLAKRGIFITLIDVMQLSYASVRTYATAFSRLENLGARIPPFGSMRAYDLIDFPEYSCKAKDVTISNPWIDYALFYTKENPLSSSAEMPVFRNNEFIVYNRNSIIRVPCIPVTNQYVTQ